MLNIAITEIIITHRYPIKTLMINRVFSNIDLDIIFLDIIFHISSHTTDKTTPPYSANTKNINRKVMFIKKKEWELLFPH